MATYTDKPTRPKVGDGLLFGELGAVLSVHESWCLARMQSGIYLQIRRPYVEAAIALAEAYAVPAECSGGGETLCGL